MERHRESIADRFFGSRAGQALLKRSEQEHASAQNEERRRLAAERRELVKELGTIGSQLQGAVAKADAAVVAAKARLEAAKRARDEAQRVRMVRTSVLEGQIQRIDGRLEETSPAIATFLDQLSGYLYGLQHSGARVPFHDGRGWKSASNLGALNKAFRRLAEIRGEAEALRNEGLSDAQLMARLDKLWASRPQGSFAPPVPASAFKSGAVLPA